MLRSFLNATVSISVIMTDGNLQNLPPLRSRVRVPEHVLMRLVGDELVLLNLREEKYFGLNAVGARMMDVAENGATLDEVVERLMAEFEIGREQLEMDVRTVAADLIAAGLIEESPLP